MPKAQMKNRTKTSLFSKGSILAEEDAVEMQKYSKSVICISQTGELLAWDLNQFVQLKFNNYDTWNMISDKSTKKNEFENKI